MVAFEKRIARLDAVMGVIELDDVLPEAGRRLLAEYFAEVLRLSGSAEYDADTLNTMDMIVRRMRHLMAVLSEYFKDDALAPFTKKLDRLHKPIARAAASAALLRALQAQTDLESDAVDAAEAAHQANIKRLNKRVQRKKFGKFAKAFTTFLTKDDKGGHSHDKGVAPLEVRHLVPVLLHDALAQMRAYEVQFGTADLDLRGFNAATVSFYDLAACFQPLLGRSIGDFLASLEAFIAQLRVAERAAFADSVLGDAAPEYVAALQSQHVQFIADLPEIWGRLNTRTNLKKFSDALLVLR